MSLTDEILCQISAYETEQFDAEANVIKAHMEACLRDIRISEECERAGIIMEGDIIPKRDGENIFKYILLFLPRLIINILRKFSRWISGNPEIRTTEELKELARKKEEELIKNRKDALVEICRKNVVDAVNFDLHRAHPSAKYVTAYIAHDGTYSCKWGIKSVRDIGKIYDAYINYFAKYIEVFERLDQKKDLIIDDTHNQDIIEFERELTRVRSNNVAEGIVSNEFSEDIDIEAATELEKSCKSGEVAQRWTYIENQMNQLISLYHKMDQDSKVSQSNLRFATRYYDSINMVFNAFAKFNTFFQECVEGVLYVYKIYPDKIKKIFDGKGKEYDDEAKDTFENILKQNDFDKPKYFTAPKKSKTSENK